MPVWKTRTRSPETSCSMSLSAVTMTTSKPWRLGLLGERADDVVGLVAGQLDDRDPIRRAGPRGSRGAARRDRPPSPRGWPCTRRTPRAAGSLRPVPGGGQKVGAVLPDHLAEHRDETVDGVGRPAGGRRETLDRVVGPMDVRHRVHQVEGGAGRRHGSRILCGAAGGVVWTTEGPFGAPFARREVPNIGRSAGFAAERSGKRSGVCEEEDGGQKKKRATRCRCRAIQ